MFVGVEMASIVQYGHDPETKFLVGVVVLYNVLYKLVLKSNLVQGSVYFQRLLLRELLVILS